MSETTKTPSTLSEISHLFLSSLRSENNRPKRTPPTSRPVTASIDLTPEEFDKVSEGEEEIVSAPVTAILASHLDDAGPAISAYAQHLIAHNQRVGLIEIGADELRLSCLVPGSDENETSEPTSYFEPRHLAEAIEELNSDIDRWLVVLINPKLVQSQSALRKISHWLLITACDSDGVVAAYRSLKALSPLARPRLTVALLDAANSEQVDRVYQKMSNVCDQFLHWPIERGPALRSSTAASIHTIMHWNPPHESAETPAPHWQVIETFLSRAQADEPDISPEEHQQISASSFKAVEAPAPVAAPVKLETAAVAAPVAPAVRPNISDATPILSLTTTSPSAILDSILQHNQTDLIACPVPLPMCETAKLTVGRDRRLLLLAVAGRGLNDLRSIAYAYRWLNENRQLVAMAVPQLAIDSAAKPKLRLLIDHADRDAHLLGPLLENPLVEMQPYRALNWSGRLGLLLEAA
ncbi:MAG TPA: hypothetical protein VGG19_09550 [Tepidisphaeraceae bacterium]|jgi:hypothetical protein